MSRKCLEIDDDKVACYPSNADGFKYDEDIQKYQYTMDGQNWVNASVKDKPSAFWTFLVLLFVVSSLIGIVTSFGDLMAGNAIAFFISFITSAIWGIFWIFIGVYFKLFVGVPLLGNIG